MKYGFDEEMRNGECVEESWLRRKKTDSKRASAGGLVEGGFIYAFQGVLLIKGSSKFNDTRSLGDLENPPAMYLSRHPSVSGIQEVVSM